MDYKTDFCCTYQYITKYETSFILYQLQMLQAFDITQFDDEKINKITEQVYEKYKTNNYISAIINSDELIQNELKNIDDLTKFRMCFGYDTFHLFHSLLCSLINNTDINEKNYKKLLNKK